MLRPAKALALRLDILVSYAKEEEVGLGGRSVLGLTSGMHFAHTNSKHTRVCPRAARNLADSGAG
jgi:hypothetical protein